MKPWSFYGRQEERERLAHMFAQPRWFFAQLTGRRRIGKTRLIQEAIQSSGGRPVFYVQIPDSEEEGVISTFLDALETFEVPSQQFPRPRSMLELAKTLEAMALEGYIVVLDEFQYFNHKRFTGLCSLLQAAVDRLSSKAHKVRGGWIVMGSIHSEMVALLEDRHAPLYSRVTHSFELRHLDIASVLAILREHADDSPERLLFLWSLFEGVPKFYRDCYEEEVLAAKRRELLQRIFFESSSPLRTEAENWFLRELHGRYDMLLKFVARHPGKTHGELVQAIRDVCGDDKKQIGFYLSALMDRFRLIESKLPIFAQEKERNRRYYLSDNFLRAWLVALANPVAAKDFKPMNTLVEEADQRMAEVEGSALEKLVGHLYEERGRKGLGDFALSARIQGYWDRQDTEIDLVAVNADDKRIRFGSCKRSSDRLLSGVTAFKEHVERFLQALPKYATWKIDHVGISPRLSARERKVLTRHDVIPQDLIDLTKDL